MLARGETVIVGLSTTTTLLPRYCNLYDSNGNIRTLASTERLILTDLNGVVGLASVRIFVFLSSTLSTQPVLVFSQNFGSAWKTAYEGMPFPIGQVPYINDDTATNGLRVMVGGTGYIIQDGANQVSAPLWLPAQ